MKKIMLKLFAGVTAAALLLCSCGSGGSGTSDNTLRLATMYSGWTVPFHYAYTSGLYSELGLNIEEQFFDNGPTINEALASGDIDIGPVGAMPSISGGIANGTKVIAWAEDDEASVRIYARNDSDIVKSGKGHVKNYPNIYGTAKDWKGKSVVCAQGTSSHFTLLATLEALGLTQEDIEIINMEGASGAAAFAAGTGDIFVGFDPQWTDFHSNSDKYTCISTCADAGKKLNCVITATSEFCEQHPDLVVKFLEGFIKTLDQFYNDKQAYYDQMYAWQTYYGECTQELAQFSADIKPIRSLEEQKTVLVGDGNTSEMKETLMDIADFMVENKLIESSDKDKLFGDDSNFIETKYFLEAYENVKAE